MSGDNVVANNGSIRYRVARLGVPNGLRVTLVLYPCDNYGFSVPVGFRSKAQCEDNGHSLVEHWNAAAGPHRDAHRVNLSTPTDCVPPLDKEMAIACKARLGVNVDKLTEPAIITGIEHLNLIRLIPA